MRRAPICASLIPRWIDQCCGIDAHAYAPAGALYDSWRRFARQHRVEPGSPAEFARAMEARGFECDQLPGDRHRIRWGIRL